MIDDLASAYGARSRLVDANGLQLHVVEAGPPGAEPVLLLHGFPDFWYGWRFQIEALASAGLHVVVPDQRGYNLSDKPHGLRNYSLDVLVEDILGLIASGGWSRASIVGHDWGGAVAWWLAIHYPEAVDKLVIVNAPHPAVMGRALRRSWEQRIRSLYMGFFQLPGIPEAWLRRDDWKSLRAGIARSSRPGTFSEEDFRRYRQAWGREGAITAMLNWYRAVRLLSPRRMPLRQVEVPTRVIWGARDPFLMAGLAGQSVERCCRGDLLLIPEAAHWVHLEEQGRVNASILEFLSSQW